ncbi:beta family protein [Methylorubrum suomiense]|uniref:Beta protein n=1 Tax=Methylorubrum suomiense TaxID=144191 RepID=A0ABQ4UR89_9HYPH|nr:beta family protein [Methylorubrum suomiense]GJE74757.1 hypothetical protein BGCPKDLD_1330 [Methylorubrum suomiense]
MSNSKNLLYVPALRAKAGEIRGIQRLAPDIIDKIIPHFIVPPPKDIDPEKQRQLTQEEIIYGTGRKIAEHWPLRDAFLDTRFLFSEFGEETSLEWLPRIFQVAKHAGAKLIPVLTPSDALSNRSASFRKVLSDGPIKAVLRIKFDEVDADTAAYIAKSLSLMGISEQECVIISDFSEADFSSPKIVGQIAQSVLEDLQEIGRWQSIVFQGSNYPTTNPASDNNSFVVPRNEWLAWQEAVKLDGRSTDRLVFGDFGADCSKIKFQKNGGGIPIRHYRYALISSWLVVRGSPTGTAKDAMRQVCMRIINSGQFAGREFSSADDFIYRCAQGWEGPGNGTTWREINTTHHVTRAVRDIGAIKGLTFKSIPTRSPTEQASLFETINN